MPFSFGRRGKASITKGTGSNGNGTAYTNRKRNQKKMINNITNSDSIRAEIIKNINDLNEHYISSEELKQMQRHRHLQYNEELKSEFIENFMSEYNKETNPFNRSDIKQFSDKYEKYIKAKILEGIQNKEEYLNDPDEDARAKYNKRTYKYMAQINPFASNGGNRNKMSKKTKYNKTKTNNKNKKTKMRKRM